ncbi:MAG: hypothetical protein JWO12_30 [Frankiales bacterium]|nr:hypothetical protein [Frankiales bacterium]
MTGSTVTDAITETSGAAAVTGRPLRILRSEGLVLLAVALATFFSQLDEPYWLVPLLLFVPDLFMVGYARSARTGAALYNLAHSYPAPALLGAIAVGSSNHLWEAVALVWVAHIGMDRALGYGLKYDDSFTHTHLGTIGR